MVCVGEASVVTCRKLGHTVFWNGAKWQTYTGCTKAICEQALRTEASLSMCSNCLLCIRLSCAEIFCRWNFGEATGGHTCRVLRVCSTCRVLVLHARRAHLWWPDSFCGRHCCCCRFLGNFGAFRVATVGQVCRCLLRACSTWRVLVTHARRTAHEVPDSRLLGAVTLLIECTPFVGLNIMAFAA